MFFPPIPAPHFPNIPTQIPDLQPPHKREILELNIQIDDNSDVDEIALQLSELCKALNAYHIASGGSGLKIDDWEIGTLSQQLTRV